MRIKVDVVMMCSKIGVKSRYGHHSIGTSVKVGSIWYWTYYSTLLHLVVRISVQKLTKKLHVDHENETKILDTSPLFIRLSYYIGKDLVFMPRSYNSKCFKPPILQECITPVRLKYSTHLTQCRTINVQTTSSKHKNSRHHRWKDDSSPPRRQNW